MNLQYLLKHPSLFPAVIGITQLQFDSLVVVFERAYFKCWYRKAWSIDRVRAVGGGRKTVLKTIREKLFFILFYYKTYPTFRLASVLFAVDKETTHRWKVFLEKVLWMTLGHQLVLPRKKVRTMAGMLEICPDLQDFLVDATERSIQRPQENQEFYYSGKKKRHTVKNQLLIHPSTKKILAISKTVEGKRHDKQLCDDDGMILRAPPGAMGGGDSGYEGIRELNPLIKIVLPFKKPRKKELTAAQKETNQVFSSVRVRVEHVIGALKKFDVLAERYRGRDPIGDCAFKNIAALYNFTRFTTS
ncbi:MAG TPA: transposase family protein [Patescibacteria group bacterium]|nr:transposase family protein [Patescibacteria group bacterium]